MANRRMISKSISVSEQANVLADFAALLFIWMLPHTDDWGISQKDQGTCGPHAITDAGRCRICPWRYAESRTYLALYLQGRVLSPVYKIR